MPNNLTAAQTKKLSTLTNQRNNVQLKLNRYKTFVENFSLLDAPMQLELRTETIVPLLQKFEEIQFEIEEIDNSNEQQAHRDVFETAYYDSLQRAYTFIPKPGRNSNTAHNRQIPPSSTDKDVKLPTIALPTFDGAYDQWLSFRDTFTALIDKTSLNDVLKFHYLKTSLNGDAAQVIHSLETTASNYKVAWKLVKERYENKKLIAQNHVSELINSPSITKESHTAIRRLLDSSQRNIRALKALGEPTDQWSTLLVFLISSKLDSTSRREWETQCSKEKSMATYDQLVQFLQNRSQLLESLDTNKAKLNTVTSNQATPKFKGKSNQPASTNMVATPEQQQCVICKQQLHRLYKCKRFLELPVASRAREVNKHKLCFNCLNSNHITEACRCGPCRVCQAKHNTLLHVDASPQKQESPQASITNHCAQTNQFTQAILGTAIIYVMDRSGKPQVCRALLDSGSQSNFLSSACCKRLKLKTQKIHMPICGISGASSTVSSCTESIVKSRINAFKIKTQFLVIPQITGKIPASNLDISNVNIPEKLELADPNFYESNDIDLLLGAGLFFRLLCVGQINSPNSGSIMQKTHFGWIISGNVPSNSSIQSNQLHTYCVSNQSIENQMRKFWELEEATMMRHFTNEERKCEEIFQSTTIRPTDGRFVVQLPFRNNIADLGKSREMALKRFQGLERRLDKNTRLKEQYTKFIKEYEALGHMTEIKDNSNDNIRNYTPHHCVINDSSLTTRLRVVFDASAKTSSNISLNETLMVGPTIQDTLFAILLRFRQHNIVISADVVKMYLQILIAPEHCNFQYILWRDNSDEPIKSYQLNTVTYGTASAPFTAVRCLHEVANINQEKEPEICKIIKQDFYVDDLLTGASTIEEAQNVKKIITKLLDEVGFKLHKWVSNRAEVTPEHEYQNTDSVQFDRNPESKILGLSWRYIEDVLTYHVSSDQLNLSPSKRIILPIISSIFDPLGLVGPVTIQTKILLQELWQCQCNWDESLPQDIYTCWMNIQQQLTDLNELEIPRQVTCFSPNTIEVHGFCDASERAYGACIYLKSTNSDGKTDIHLLCAKSLVAPIKTTSLPRLELCGALLLTQLHKTVREALTLTITNTYFWSDSTITLAWLNSEPNRWITFVANRVSEIQQSTKIYNATWKHVVSSDNPAHIISRGCNPRHLKKNQLWWHVPLCLMNEERYWPNSVKTDENVEEEIRKSNTLVAVQSTDSQFSPFNEFSSLTKLTRVISYCRRFINHTSQREDNYGPLLPEEIKSTTKLLIKLAQQEVFQVEFQSLKNSKGVNPKSSLIRLNPFIDTNGLLRVGSRILIGGAMDSLPQEDVITIPINRLNRYQLLQNIVQHFWKLWQLEYISTLQTRNKWTKTTSDLKEGALVIIKEDNTPPCRWKMGRIISLHPGTDNLPRVVTVKMSNGEFKRPVSKVCILQIDNA